MVSSMAVRRGPVAHYRPLQPEGRASLGPSSCISPRQSAGCFPILIDRPFTENTASRTDKP